MMGAHDLMKQSSGKMTFIRKPRRRMAERWSGSSRRTKPIRIRLKARSEREGRIRRNALLLTLVLVAANSFFDMGGTAWIQLAYFSWVVVIVNTPSIFHKEIRILRKRVKTEPVTISTSCIAFYRSELQGRLNDLQNGRSVAPWLMLWALMFGVLGQRGLLGLVYGTLNSILAAVLGLSSLILVTRWYVQMRAETPRVQSELEEVDAQVSGNPK
jgi:hypothetical protein